MRFVIAAAMAALLAAPAFAQVSVNSREESAVEKQYQQKLKDDAEQDRRYRDVLKQTRGANAPVASDPWANIRPAAPEKRTR